MKGIRAFNMVMRSKGSKSKKIPNGTVLRTRDVHLPGGDASKHETEPWFSDKNILYRMVMVIDSNRKDELARVELTVNKRGKTVTSKHAESRSRARPFIHVKFSDGTALKKTSGKLEKHKIDADFTEEEAHEIKMYAIKNENVPKSTKKDNRKKLKWLKASGSRYKK